MAKRNARKKEPDSEKITEGVIDVDEVLEDGAPVELARVVGVHHARIREIKVQANRPNTGWLYIKRVIRYPEGPDVEVDEVCSRIVRLCLDDAHTHGPAKAYRVRFGLNTESDKLDHRYCTIRIKLSEDGELVVTDAVGSGEGESPLGPYGEVMDHAIKALQEVTSATERIGNIGGALARVLEVQTDILEKAANAVTSDVDLQVRLREIEHEDNVAWADWKTRETRIETLGRMGDKIAGPAGEALGEVIKIFGDMFGEQFFGSKGPMAEQWSEFLDGLDETESKAFRAIFNADEWSVVEAARGAKDDAEFASQFRKMIELVGERMTQDEFMAKLATAAGQHMAKLLPIWKKMQEQGI